MVATGVHDAHYKNRRDLIMALSAAMNEELVELADAGCPVIQVEEPAIHGMVGVVPEARFQHDDIRPREATRSRNVRSGRSRAPW